jgi:spectinomycin phosphotransferase
MPPNTPTLPTSILQALTRSYNITPHTLTLLPIGADQNAMVYKAEAPNKDYFVKIIKGVHNSVNIAVIELLQAAGFRHIIAPIKTVERQSMHHAEGYTLLVYPFIAGDNGFNQPLTAAEWHILGQELRKLHDINVPDALQKQLRRETYSAIFRDAVTALYANLHNVTASDPIALKFINSLRQNAAIIHRLVTRAGELAQSVKEIAAPLVLCHTDIHGGNVLLDRNNALYIVDWDAPMMAPKERDLMFIGGGVANVWNKPDEEALFYQAYGKTAINREMLAYYRHERIVEDIAGFAESIIFTPSSNDSKKENYHHFNAMFAPNGVIDIAFRTDISTYP